MTPFTDPPAAMRSLLITHGDLGASLLRSARTIHAVDAPITVVSNVDHDLEGLRDVIADWLATDAGPALVMVDVGGGSCGVAARLAAADRAKTWVLGGVNLPMVLTYLGHHETLDPGDLVSKMLDRALNAVAVLDPPSAR